MLDKVFHTCFKPGLNQPIGCEEYIEVFSKLYKVEAVEV